MCKFLSCGLIAAFAIILPTALEVCAEPPPAEPVVVSIEQVPSTDCPSNCPEEQVSK